LAVWVVAVAGEHVERALGAVEDASEQARAELDLQRAAGVSHRLADPQSRGVFVDLDRGALAIEADHLAWQCGVADADDVVQPHAGQAVGDHDWSGNAPDLTFSGASFAAERLLQRRSRVHQVLDSSRKVSS
jgi:hypothetical protein